MNMTVQTHGKTIPENVNGVVKSLYLRLKSKHAVIKIVQWHTMNNWLIIIRLTVWCYIALL